jgi:hypothetical protein
VNRLANQGQKKQSDTRTTLAAADMVRTIAATYFKGIVTPSNTPDMVMS